MSSNVVVTRAPNHTSLKQIPTSSAAPAPAPSLSKGNGNGNGNINNSNNNNNELNLSSPKRKRIALYAILIFLSIIGFIVILDSVIKLFTRPPSNPSQFDNHHKRHEPWKKVFLGLFVPIGLIVAIAIFTIVMGKLLKLESMNPLTNAS